MIRLALYLFLFISTLAVYSSCKKVEPKEIENSDVPQNPIGVNVPQDGSLHEKLSSYNFFEGAIKNQLPVAGVLPYEPISGLFTDYALKKRFIWMPAGVAANYDGASKNLDFPVGTVLIKNFYYDHVSPGDKTQILETRIMILKASGWIFAEYVWNDEQTEAFLDMDGSFKQISWNQNGSSKTTNYRIPSSTECMVCHKLNDMAIPIGVKPQSLNKEYNYAEGMVNQLQKMVDMGYLNSYPGNIETVVDYSDESQSLDLRLRSYLDINCAHCHSDQKHCDYRPIRLAFSETNSKANIGLCIEPDEEINASMNYIIAPSNIQRSVMHFRLNTNDEALRMPLLGKTMVHQEGVQLLEDWINSIETCE